MTVLAWPAFTGTRVACRSCMVCGTHCSRWKSGVNSSTVYVPTGAKSIRYVPSGPVRVDRCSPLVAPLTLTVAPLAGVPSACRIRPVTEPLATAVSSTVTVPPEVTAYRLAAAGSSCCGAYWIVPAAYVNWTAYEPVNTVAVYAPDASVWVNALTLRSLVKMVTSAEIGCPDRSRKRPLITPVGSSWSLVTVTCPAVTVIGLAPSGVFLRCSHWVSEVPGIRNDRTYFPGTTPSIRYRPLASVPVS